MTADPDTILKIMTEVKSQDMTTADRGTTIEMEQK